MTIKTGDKIKFRDRKGNVIVGRVSRIREKKYRGKRRELAMRFGGTLGHMVAEVAPENFNGYYTVPLTMCEVVEDGDREDAMIAREKVGEVKAARKSQQRERTTRKVTEAISRDITRLRVGDKIEVKFRDSSWWPAIYEGMTRSGNVRFRQAIYSTMPEKGYHPKTRTTSPQYVRVEGDK